VSRQIFTRSSNPPNSFDVVVANVLHLVPDLDAALKSLQRVLRAGGLRCFSLELACGCGRFPFLSPRRPVDSHIGTPLGLRGTPRIIRHPPKMLRPLSRLTQLFR
jgi:SAM-dependent methyltransferase